MSELSRILVVSEPGKNGVFCMVRDLIRHLHRAHPGICVDLAYSSRRQLGEVAGLAAEVRAHGGEAVDLVVGNGPELADFRAFARLSALIHRRRPQVIHAHSSKAGALCRFRACLPGCPPVIYMPHAYYGLARVGGGREAFFNALETVLGRVGLTICCSRDERDFAFEKLRLNPKKLTVIHNGIDTDVFVPATPEEKQALRAELGIPCDGPLLVTIGRDTPQKNYAPLYAALDGLFSIRSDFRFAHAGEGSPRLTAALRPSAQARCHSFKFLSAPQTLLRAADGFILPSLYEGLSLSMIEALSCGTPVILSDGSGLRGIRELSFRWTHWLPSPENSPTFTATVAAGITAWLEAGAGPIPGQRTLARELFDQRAQFEKVVAIYRSLA